MGDWQIRQFVTNLPLCKKRTAPVDKGMNKSSRQLGWLLPTPPPGQSCVPIMAREQLNNQIFQRMFVKVTEFYSPSHKGGIIWNNPDLEKVGLSLHPL